MKIAAVFVTVALAQNDVANNSADGISSRRYDDLHKIAKFYMPDFDERKYWAYGCNCLILGDRPMSDPGHGKPVDELDTVCKAYKDCVKCVQMEYGSQCIGEFKKYRYGLNAQRGEVQCRDKPATCERALCECDAQFGRQMPAHRHVFSDDYHLFWSTTGWSPEEKCLHGGNGPYEPQCCGADDGPLHIFNAKTKECCANGSVAPQGQC